MQVSGYGMVNIHRYPVKFDSNKGFQLREVAAINYGKGISDDTRRNDQKRRATAAQGVAATE